MLNKIFLMLTFGLMLHSQHVDVYGYSVPQTVDFIWKRDTKDVETKPVNNAAETIEKKQEIKEPLVKAIKVKEPVENLHTGEKTLQNVQKPETSDIMHTPPSVAKAVTAAANENPKSNTSIIPHRKSDQEYTGAMLRSFYVFLGLSALVLLYLAYRSFKMRSGVPPPTTVRKYGVVGRRSDLEMLPLPLNEDDAEDDTLFDAGSQQNR